MEVPRECHTQIEIELALTLSDREILASYLHLGSGWYKPIQSGLVKHENGK
jgi:hypothetical protein